MAVDHQKNTQQPTRTLEGRRDEQEVRGSAIPSLLEGVKFKGRQKTKINC